MEREKKRRGFTLIELLVVICIILLLMALLLPAIVKALCAAKEAATEHLIDLLTQAATSYETDFAIFPTGDGSDSARLADKLETQGPRKAAYFQFKNMDLRVNGDTGDIINPVRAGETPPAGLIFYRNNRDNLPDGTNGGQGGGAAPVKRTKAFDLWCAGCDYKSTTAPSQYAINNWE